MPRSTARSRRSRRTSNSPPRRRSFATALKRPRRLVAGRAWRGTSVTDGPGRGEDFAGDGLALRNAADRVVERSAVAIGKTQRRTADDGAAGASRAADRGERNRIERRPAGEPDQVPAVCARSGLGQRRYQPHRRAVVVERVPGRENRVVLVREVDAPARLRTRGRRPPEVLIIGGERQVGLCTERAGGKGPEGFARDRLGLC